MTTGAGVGAWVGTAVGALVGSGEGLGIEVGEGATVTALLGLAVGFGYFDFRAAGSAGSDAIWSVQVPIAAGWDAGWSDVCVGLWSAQDGSVSGHIAKQAGVANKMVFVCTTTAAVIAASKGCRFQYTYRTFA